MSEIDWSKKRFDDWITRRPGSIMGEKARKLDESFHEDPLPSNPGNQRVDPRGGGGGATSSGGEFFPSVDRFFDHWLPMPVRRVLGLVLIAMGALAGAGAAPQIGIGTGAAAVLGGFVGLAVIPLLIFSVKLALLTLVLGGLALVGYIVYLLATGA